MLEKKKIVCEFTLFDDASTKEKFTIMNKFEIAMDDERNNETLDFGDAVEKLMQFGKKYRMSIEEIE